MRTLLVPLAAMLVAALDPANAAATLKRPAALTATATSPTSVVVTWRDTNAGEVAYVVERRTGSHTRLAVVGRTAADAETYTDDGLSPDTLYHYRVRAVGVDGRLGPTPRQVAVTTPAGGGTGDPPPPPPPPPPPAPPASPDRVTAAAAGCARVDVSWAALAGIAGYRVYRNGTSIAAVGAGTTALSDAAVAPSTAYAFTVTAVDGGGAESAPSAPATVTTPACPVPPVADAGPDQHVLAGQSLQLSGSGSRDADGHIVTWAWSFGDGGTATGATPGHAWSVAGTYVVTLTVTDDAGLQDADTATVVVDPAVVVGGAPWARIAGGPDVESGQAVATGADGSVVVAGYAASAVNLGGGVLPAIGPLDLVLAKYTGAGAPVWSRRFGGTDTVLVQAVAVAPSGDVLVAGSFTGTADLGTGAMASAGARDVFVAAYSAAGTSRWVRRFGSTNDDIAYGVAVDAAGNVFVTGTFRGSVDFGGGALVSTFDGFDIMVVKLAGGDGHHLWSHRFTNGGADIAYALALDPAGNPVVAGSFNGHVDFGCGNHVAGGGHDVFVAKLTGAAGACVWSRSMGGSDTDRALGVAVDGAGDVAVTGFFTFTVDFGTGPLTAAGGNDAFVAKLNGATGATRWARRFGGSSIDYGTGVAAARDGSVVLTGYFQGAVDFGTGPLVSAGLEDAFVAELDTNGTPRSSGRFGGTATDEASAIALAPSGDALVTGFFAQTALFGGTVLTSAGQQDLFLLALTR